MIRPESKPDIEELQRRILRTLSGPALSPEAVIAACDALSGKLDEAELLPTLTALGMPQARARRELETARQTLSRGYLEERLSRELGTLPTGRFKPYGTERRVRQEWKPLGVLLHVAAGNADALPAYSVLEGLLTGNINVLKLPGGGDVLSVMLLQELAALEPAIADYVYITGCPSEDTDTMKTLAAVADAVVVWGGDAAVSAVRALAPPNVRIVEWGHKLSFAYVTAGGAADEALAGVAYNLCDTEQRLCTSCQGLFVDGNYADAVKLAERFAHLLEAQSGAMPAGEDIRAAARRTLELYTEALEAVANGKSVFRGKGCGVIASADSRLELSYMNRVCWVKPLPRARLLEELTPHKSRLHTAALLCADTERAPLESLLFRAGIVRVTDGKSMSEGYCGMPHDGEFSLRRYAKITSCEYE